MKLISGKSAQKKTFELAPELSEIKVSAQVSLHCPFLLDLGAQQDSSPTESL